MITAFLLAAQAAPASANDSISLTALTAFLVGILGAVAALINAIKAKEAKAKGVEEGRKQEKQERTVSISNQPVGVQLSDPHLTWTHHSALEQRVTKLETRLDNSEKEAGERYIQILEAGSEREHRITDKLGNKMEGIAREIHGRLDLHFGPKPRTPRSTH